jgi:hypothetical protein
VVTSAGVVGQVWRSGGRRQVPVAHLLRRTEVVDLTHAVARVLGRMLGHSGVADPVAAHVALLARKRSWSVLTSDAADLYQIDPTLSIETILAQLRRVHAAEGDRAAGGVGDAGGIERRGDERLTPTRIATVAAQSEYNLLDPGRVARRSDDR